MIQDKDYTMRLIRQLSNMLSKLLLGKREQNRVADDEKTIDSQLNDIFRLRFEVLEAFTHEELDEIVHQYPQEYRADLYELLGHLFYYKFKASMLPIHADKSRYCYKKWVAIGKTYSFTILKRIDDLTNEN